VASFGVHREGVELSAREALGTLALGEERHERGVLTRAQQRREPEDREAVVFQRRGVALAVVKQEQRVRPRLGEAAARAGAAISAEDVDLEALAPTGLEHYRNSAETYGVHRNHAPAPEAQALGQETLQGMGDALLDRA